MKELTHCLTLNQFPQAFPTNPFILQNLPKQNSYCDHRNVDGVNGFKDNMQQSMVLNLSLLRRQLIASHSQIPNIYRPFYQKRIEFIHAINPYRKFGRAERNSKGLATIVNLWKTTFVSQRPLCFLT